MGCDLQSCFAEEVMGKGAFVASACRGKGVFVVAAVKKV